MAALPLLYPTIIPLVDLPGHMGRYRVMLADGEVPVLARNFDFHWRLIGNLGADLLIIPFAHVFGLEVGTKLIVIAIVVMTSAGMLWLAREVHGRIPATALFALPLVYGSPFQFGLLNFVLSIALVFPALALWLRLAPFKRFRLRAAVFMVIAAIVWVTHTVGWGLLGIAAFGIEIGHRRAMGEQWRQTIGASIAACLPLAPPLVALLLTRSSAVEAASRGWVDPAAKIHWFLLLLSDRWE